MKELAGVDGRAVYGLAGEELAAFGDELDLLVVGSRGYGPLRRLVTAVPPTTWSATRAARCSCCPAGHCPASEPVTAGERPGRSLPQTLRRGGAQSIPSWRDERRRRNPDATTPAATRPPAETIRIVLADDHAVVRSGLRMLLDNEGDFEVVAEASDVESARRYVRGHHPGVLVLDLNMPGGSSLEAIPLIREESPGHPDRRADDAAGARVRTRGARCRCARLRSQGGRRRGARRSRAAAAVGESYLNPRLGARIASEPPPGPPDDLSNREVDVLRLIALGHTNAEIAEQLYLSVRTVETHRSHIQQKLRLSTRAELVGYALERGLISTGTDADS